MNRILGLLVVFSLLAGCGGQGAKQASPSAGFDGSGYLGQQYYQQLKRVDAAGDQMVYRYISPDFNASDYDKVLIDPVVSYPKPEPTKNVSMATLQELEGKMTGLLKDSFSKVVPLSPGPGRGVLRVQTAITGIDISDKKLAGYEYIPIALIASSISKASGERDQEVQLYLETKVLDSYSNEVVAVGVRQIQGEDLEDANAKLQAHQLNEGLSVAGNDIVRVLRNVFSK